MSSVRDATLPHVRAYRCGGPELACSNVAPPPFKEENVVVSLVAGQSVLVVVERDAGLWVTYSLEAAQL